MFYRNIFVLTVSYILLLNSVRSNELLENNGHVSENVKKPLDLKSRRVIAEEYFHKSPQVIENWIDPHDSFKSMIQQQLKLSFEEKKEHHDDVRLESINVPTEPNNVQNEQTEIPQLNPPGNEENSTFDVKEDVNDERIEEKLHGLEVESGESLSKDGNKIESYNIYINNWLQKLVLKIEKESHLVPNAINFPIDSVMFTNLKELSTAKSLEISQLDEVICKIIDQSSIVGKEKFDWMILFDDAKNIACPIIIFLCLAICVYSIYQSIIFTILCCVAVSSVLGHWMHLHELLFEPLSASLQYLALFTVIPILIISYMILIMLFNYRIIFPLERDIPPGRVLQLKSSESLNILDDTVNYKFPSIGKEECMQKSLMQDADIRVGTCELLKECENSKGIQNFLEESSVHSGTKDLTSVSLNIPHSETSTVLEQSDIDDDISIIDSDESYNDTEILFMEHNLAKQSMNVSFHFSPEGCDSLS